VIVELAARQGVAGLQLRVGGLCVVPGRQKAGNALLKRKPRAWRCACKLSLTIDPSDVAIVTGGTERAKKKRPEGRSDPVAKGLLAVAIRIAGTARSTVSLARFHASRVACLARSQVRLEFPRAESQPLDRSPSTSSKRRPEWRPYEFTP
jgi:hypothetical protein